MFVYMACVCTECLYKFETSSVANYCLSLAMSRAVNVFMNEILCALFTPNVNSLVEVTVIHREHDMKHTALRGMES